MHPIIEQAVSWTGAFVLISGGAFATLFIWYWTVEYALRLFKVKALLLAFAFDRLKARQPRVATKKARA